MFDLKLLAATLFAASAMNLAGAAMNSFTQTNLQSDLPGVAANQDPNLVNPWGIVAGPATPFWVANNGTGTSTLYNTSGAALPLVVTLPVPSGSSPPADPTGIVFNNTATNFNGGRFIFATESGTIVNWI